MEHRGGAKAVRIETATGVEEEYEKEEKTSSGGGGGSSSSNIKIISSMEGDVECHENGK
jgi:hypothetical protein